MTTPIRFGTIIQVACPEQEEAKTLAKTLGREVRAKVPAASPDIFERKSLFPGEPGPSFVYQIETSVNPNHPLDYPALGKELEGLLQAFYGHITVGGQSRFDAAPAKAQVEQWCVDWLKGTPLPNVLKLDFPFADSEQKSMLKQEILRKVGQLGVGNTLEIGDRVIIPQLDINFPGLPEVVRIHKPFAPADKYHIITVGNPQATSLSCDPNFERRGRGNANSGDVLTLGDIEITLP